MATTEVIKETTRNQRKWSSIEEQKIVEYLTETLRSGNSIEKPKADTYYATMLLNLQFTNCSATQLKNKVRHLKNAYTKAIKWRNETGQGVLSNEGESSLRGALLKMCTYFDELDEVYGSKLNINPPAILTVLPPTSNELEDSQLHSCSEEPVDESVTTENQPMNILPSEPKKSQKRPKVTSALEALTDARNERNVVESKKLNLDTAKLDFEKEKWLLQLEMDREKWQFEKEARQTTMELESKKIELESQNFRYECELKYRTQFEIAKMANNQK